MRVKLEKTDPTTATHLQRVFASGKDDKTHHFHLSREDEEAALIGSDLFTDIEAAAYRKGVQDICSILGVQIDEDI